MASSVTTRIDAIVRLHDLDESQVIRHPAVRSLVSLKTWDGLLHRDDKKKIVTLVPAGALQNVLGVPNLKRFMLACFVHLYDLLDWSLQAESSIVY